jgi:diguanylate cyclase (GGDEF)-like protein/PAS domain S-box-containing protein
MTDDVTTSSADAAVLGGSVEAGEIARLATLYRLNLRDSPPSEAFDRITRLAAQVLGVPIVLVSLVDATRQWFVSRFGLEALHTPREVSFCAHAVQARAVLRVPDATRDTRFCANPLVTGPPHIRAYLGIPLTTQGGHVLGTLCAIDRRPREFDEQTVATLSDFAQIIEEAIHARELAAQNESALRWATEQQALFRDTFEQAAVGITHTSLTGELIRINRRACEMLGYTADELKHRSFLDVTHPQDVAPHIEQFQQLARGQIEQFQIEKRYRRGDGTMFWAHLSAALKRSPSAHPDYIIAVIEDISARKQAESDLLIARDDLQTQVLQQTRHIQLSNQILQAQVKQLLESGRAVRAVEQRLSAITNNIPAMIGYWNRNLVCEFANEAYREWFGHAPERIVGMSMRELLGAAHFNAIELYLRLALRGHAQRFERSMKRAGGEIAFLDVRYLPDVEEGGAVRGFYVLVTDMTESRLVRMELEAANAKLSVDSATDYLTGLVNRRTFSEYSETAARWFQESGEVYGLILLDLDHFKQINDVHGHAIGDEVLRHVGRVLSGQLRDHRDVAARLGGEEFGLLCFGQPDEDALRQIAERVRAQINNEKIASEQQDIRFSASFGLALAQPAEDGWKAIYSRADAALYEAKATGRDRVMFQATSPTCVTGRFRSLRGMES